jgi:beta-xylosidase
MEPAPIALRVCLLAVAALILSFSFASNRDLDTSTSIHRVSASADLQDPVLDRNFPDPGVLEVDGVFYAFATNAAGHNIPTARSTDLVEWSMMPDAMPAVAPWVLPVRSNVWAPEPIAIGDEFRLYYTARDRESSRQCIGVASSNKPEGPYQDNASQPLICPPGYQRAIDPHPYLDSKQMYLYFSGVCCGEPNGIYAQKLSADGLSTVDSPALLLKVDTAWEGDIAEAPTMLRREGKYYLFYSGNNYRDETYAVGYAVCKSAAGPCTKAAENPILATGATVRALGPGHQTITKVGNDYWMLFHGWNEVVGYPQGGRRAMWLQPLFWRDGRPLVGTLTNRGG